MRKEEENMKYPETAARLREALSDAGFRQRDLTNEVTLNESSISRYVNGMNAPSFENALQIGKVLNVNPLWLLGYDVPKHEKQDLDSPMTQPEPKPEPELTFDYRSAHIIAIRVEKIRKEALRLIGETAVNCTGDHAVEAINYIAGVVDLAAALIEREKEKEDDE